METGAKEAAWSDALAVGLEGATRDWRVDGGIADIATETHIYEVDRLAKWHEGIGQVLHYRDESGSEGLINRGNFTVARQKVIVVVMFENHRR